MNVLVIGSGGREHALAWRIRCSSGVEAVFVAPGNGGTAADPTLENVSVDTADAATVAAFCTARAVDLVVVGPEAPLVAGLADQLRTRRIDVLGPGADGAALEGSKSFAKEIMTAAGVPTARYARVTTDAEVDAFVREFEGSALVVKADGLAAGKGVVVCDSVDEAAECACEMLATRPFGAASAAVVLEERLIGIETSYIVVTDGSRWVALPTSQDHKRLLDGDEGPNTGGMGAYSPAPFVTAEVAREIETRVIEPTLAELRRRRIDFRGFLYAGIMLTDEGPRVLEFNVRLGDPETQVLMACVDDRFVDTLVGAARGELGTESVATDEAAAVVVLAAEGYPRAATKGDEIRGLEAANAVEGVTVFHAGTTVDPDGTVRVSGGRVLGVTARAAEPDEAVARAYTAAALVGWPGMQMRTDIGKALRRA